MEPPPTLEREESPPLQHLQLEEEGVSLPQDVLDTEKLSASLLHRPASAPLARQKKQIPAAMRRHASVSSLSDAERWKTLVRYVKE